MGHHPAVAKLYQEVLRAFKSVHLDKYSADLSECVGIGTRPSGNAEGCPQLLRSPIDLGLRPPVEDLDDVDLSGDSLDRHFPEVAPARIVRVFEVHQAPLLLYGVYRPFWRQPARDRLPEEETDQLAFGGEDLLADDRCLASLEQRLGAGDAFVIGEEDGVEAHLAAAAGHLQWRDTAVKRRGTVQMEIDPDPGGPCVSGHVGYYRFRRGLREGSDTSEGWHLTGKERLSFRKKAALWN